MEKLIKLLNEYEEQKNFRDYEWRIERKTKERMCGTEIMGMSGEQFTGAYVNTEEMERIIISKKYEFIKWLVDNDKVDLKKVNNIDTGPLFDYYYDEDALIMALSINDEPIKFLISIIKDENKNTAQNND